MVVDVDCKEPTRDVMPDGETTNASLDVDEMAAARAYKENFIVIAVLSVCNCCSL
jgi:hypothetical protein